MDVDTVLDFIRILAVDPQTVRLIVFRNLDLLRIFPDALRIVEMGIGLADETILSKYV